MKTRIAELAKAYQDIISSFHHKDRDCQWEIAEVWAYGEHTGYQLNHYGYVYEDVEEVYATYDDALSGLKHHLTRAIRGELSWAIDTVIRPHMNDDESKEAAKHVMMVCERVGVTLENCFESQ